MYRTSARPAPLDFLLPPAHSPYNIDRRKEFGPSNTLPQFTPPYFEAPVRDGLRTPPADDMATTYHPQYKYEDYNGRRESAYSSSGAPTSYLPPLHPYSGHAPPSRTYSTTNQPPPASAAALRNEVQNRHLVRTQPPSPQPSARSSFMEEVPRMKSSTSDAIRPGLQIPKTISNFGGSLPDFAAQVNTTPNNQFTV